MEQDTPFTTRKMRIRRALPIAHDPHGRPIFWYNPNGEPVCGAVIGQLDDKVVRRCMRTKLTGNGRCYRHKGSNNRLKLLKGNSLRTGLYAKNLGGDTAEVLVSLLNDKQYLSLREEINLNTLEIIDLTKELSEGYDGKTWREITKLVTRVINTSSTRSVQLLVDKYKDQKNDRGVYFRSIEKLMIALNKGANHQELKRELREVTKARKELVDTELRKVTLEKTQIPAEHVLELFMSVMLIFRKYVKDAGILNAIATEIDMLSSNPKNRRSLDGKMGAGGILVPRSNVAALLTNSEEPVIDAEFTDA